MALAGAAFFVTGMDTLCDGMLFVRIHDRIFGVHKSILSPSSQIRVALLPFGGIDGDDHFVGVHVILRKISLFAEPYY